MQYTYLWKVVPTGTPTVIKHCPKCGNHSEFESSGNFRVNANQNLIDVWLIYQCRKCKSTWNMELLSRVPSRSIDKDVYLSYLQNDSKLATQYAYDIAAHNRNKVSMNYDAISYDIDGDPIQHCQGNIRLKISCEYPLELRLDKLLSQQLGLSREAIKKLHKSGKISANNSSDIKKINLNDNLLVQIDF